MEKTLFPAAMGQTVVASSENIVGYPAVTFRPLPESGVLISRLIEASIEAGSKKRQRIETILHEQNEFVFRLKRAQERAWLVVWLAHGLALKCLRERADDFLEWPLIFLPTDQRRWLQAWRSHVLPSLPLDRRRDGGRLLCVPAPNQRAP